MDAYKVEAGLQACSTRKKVWADVPLELRRELKNSMTAEVQTDTRGPKIQINIVGAPKTRALGHERA